MSTGTKVTTETEMDTRKYTVKYIAPNILGTKYYYFCIFCEQKIIYMYYLLFFRHFFFAYHFDDNASLSAYLQECLEENDVVLVKASNGMHLKEVINDLKENN